MRKSCIGKCNHLPPFSTGGFSPIAEKYTSVECGAENKAKLLSALAAQAPPANPCGMAEGVRRLAHGWHAHQVQHVQHTENGQHDMSAVAGQRQHESAENERCYGT